MTRIVVVAAVVALSLAGGTACGGGEAGVSSGTCVCAVSDAVRMALPCEVKLGGLLGERMRASVSGRLLTFDEDVLLGGFHKRPGSHPWIGEHAGKWMHAASLAWVESGDGALRAKLDRIAAGLAAAQEADGYLGTYAPAHRMGIHGSDAWDVWAHKYCMIGLLAHHDCTGNTVSLHAARRAADLLIDAFAQPGKDINATSMHAGMASTSVLEPVVQLYRTTGDPRYLEFAGRIAAAWDAPTGARVISNLLKDRTVLTVGNRKAYEMLSCLVGVCELYRSTGRRDCLDAAVYAWEDVVKNHLYITGSGSSHELWTDGRHLPCGTQDKICETCVTVTWMQLNMQLYRLLGEARFAEQLERTVYNHLLGAQFPDGSKFCYYTPLEGKKPYSGDLTCCFSSGARGLAMLPSLAYGVGRTAGGTRAVIVNLYGESQAKLGLDAGASVVVKQQTRYPADSNVRIGVAPDRAGMVFALQLRIPAWAEGAKWRLAGGGGWSAAAPGSWLVIERDWGTGGNVELDLPMRPRLVLGDHNTSDRAAIMYGPLVLAADEKLNPGFDEGALKNAALANADPATFDCRRIEAAAAPRFAVDVLRADGQGLSTLLLTPYYTAGDTGGAIQTWLLQRPRPKSR